MSLVAPRHRQVSPGHWPRPDPDPDPHLLASQRAREAAVTPLGRAAAANRPDLSSGQAEVLALDPATWSTAVPWEKGQGRVPGLMGMWREKSMKGEPQHGEAR